MGTTVAIEKDIEMLGGVPLFSGLSVEQLKIVAFSAERVTYQKGQFLYRKGDKATATFVIMVGNAEIISSSENKNATNIPVLPGAFAGETSMLTQSPRRVSLRAVDDVTALKISKDLLVRLAEDFPEIGIKMVKVLEDRLNQTLDDLGSIQADLKAGIG